ncbi:MAG: glutamate--tRNA ligase, partial [Bacteroidales bacterium]|nr:glutamate--tRNA ligase [Bacteroidales bacterium]
VRRKIPEESLQGRYRRGSRNIDTILDKCPDFKPETTEGAVKAWIEGNEWGFGKVMSPFRLAIVGEGKGPSVFDMIEVIGKDETLKRIQNLIKEPKA